jgi:hypothetical protein
MPTKHVAVLIHDERIANHSCLPNTGTGRYSIGMRGKVHGRNTLMHGTYRLIAAAVLCTGLISGCTSIYHKGIASQPVNLEERLVVRVREGERLAQDALSRVRHLARAAGEADRLRLRDRVRVAGHDIERASLAIDDVTRRLAGASAREAGDRLRRVLGDAAQATIRAGLPEATGDDLRQAERMLEDAVQACRGFAGS